MAIDQNYSFIMSQPQLQKCDNRVDNARIEYIELCKEVY